MTDEPQQLEPIRTAKVALQAEAVNSPKTSEETGPGATSGMRRVIVELASGRAGHVWSVSSSCP